LGLPAERFDGLGEYPSLRAGISDQKGSQVDQHAPPLQTQRHPWEAQYPAGVEWGMPIPTGPVSAILDRAASAWPDRVAIEYRDHPITFGALARMVDRLAAGFLAEGIGPGRTVALFLPNTPWHTVCFFAGLKAGARLVHLSPLDAPRELAHKMMDSGADVVISTDLGGLGAGAAKFVEMGLAKLLLVGEDSFFHGVDAPAPAYGERIRRLDTLFSDALPDAWPAIDPGQVALLQYTGGTTGMPKGAMLTHANMTAATSIYGSWRDAGVPDAGAQIVIGVLPMFHIYALGVILLVNISEGNRILLRPRFDVATTLRDIEEKRATTFPAVPTMLVALLAEPGAAGRDFSSLALVGSGGAPMPHEVALQVEALLGQRVRGGWGMTETAAAGTRTPVGVTARPGMIGTPLPGIELRIVSLDDPSVALAPGEVGEIAVRGPNVFAGYWNQPELNAASFVDGFFLTGDIGVMEPDGLFFIRDRKKRMIISGGFNVYPAMIENAIYEHPDVAEAIVIGVPDAYRGETAKAFVTLKAGAPTLSLEDLRVFLADRLGRHELPTALELRADLPKSPVGKLLANVLAEEERARLTPSGA
jgi:long-chain acyl-CoA synthetase